MVLVYRREVLAGPFCRDCGLAGVRDLTAHTALAGWWSFASLFMTAWAIPANLVSGRRYARLAEPQPSGALPQPPIDPGPPVYARSRFLLGMLVPLAVVGAIVAGVWSQADRDEAGTIIGAGLLDSDDLRVGDCLDLPEDQEFRDVRAVPCEQRHDAEVIAVTPLPEGPYPSPNQFDAVVDSECVPAFLEVVGEGITTPELLIDMFVPIEAAWEQGNRIATCVVLSGDGSRLTGSMRDAGR